MVIEEYGGCPEPAGKRDYAISEAARELYFGLGLGLGAPRWRSGSGDEPRLVVEGGVVPPQSIGGTASCAFGQVSRRAAAWARRQSSADLKTWRWVIAFSVPFRQSRISSPK